MEIFKKIISCFKHNYILFLALVVLISYGQLLGMHVWQDDNALFFKLANIEGKAGYLGTGPIGQGAYKYTVTPYIPIYNLFGFNTIPYFVFTILFYFAATVTLYKVFSEIFGERVGRVAGFLYAAGFIAADGYIRLFNSVITSVSIILISLLVLHLWRFSQKREFKWYLLGLLAFWGAVEFALARTHYLIAVVILWELLFNVFKKPAKVIYLSFLRLVPYVLIFYSYFIVGGDARSGQVKVWISKIFSGDLSQTYGFISSITSVIFPSWLTGFFFKVEDISGSLAGIHIPLVKLTAVSAVAVTSLFLFRNVKNRKLITTTSIILSIAWAFVSERIYTTTRLSLGYKELSLAFLGGIGLILLVLIFLKVKKHKPLYVLFVFWLLINLAAYSAYNPTVFYESINRYLSHSFFALIGALAVVLVDFKKEKRLERAVLILITLWGVGNLTANVFYQSRILATRANPARSFYKQLKGFTPQVKKGDVFYFDVDQSARGYFNEAFSVAQMPETTAIAWRYGLDRYDIKLFTNFEDLAEDVSAGNMKIKDLHSFWYRNLELTETTETVKSYFEKTGSQKTSIPVAPQIQKGELGETSQIKIDFSEEAEGSVPIELRIGLSALPLPLKKDAFPLQRGATLTSIHKNPVLKTLAFKYKETRENIVKTAGYEVSSQWRERVSSRLHDSDPTTYWQADRILFRNKREGFTIDLGRAQLINRFVFINGFTNNSPTDYSIETSHDGKNWKEVKMVSENRRLEAGTLQVTSFPTTSARFIKMVIRETLNNDSPAISEAWPVYSSFSDLDINEAETFLENPFLYLSDQEDYFDTITLLERRGEVQVYWMKDDSGRWETAENSKLKIVYDGSPHAYSIIIPPGGLKLTGIKLENIIIPGEVRINSVSTGFGVIQEQ